MSVGDTISNIGDALYNTGEASVNILGSTASVAGSTLEAGSKVAEAGSSVVEAGSRIVVKLADGTEKIVDFSSEKLDDFMLWVEEKKPPIGLPGIDVNDPEYFSKHLEAYGEQLKKWQYEYYKAETEYRTINENQNLKSVQKQSKKDRVTYLNEQIERLNDSLGSYAENDPARVNISAKLIDYENQRNIIYNSIEPDDPFITDNFFGYGQMKLNDYLDLLEKHMDGVERNIDYYNDQVTRSAYWVNRELEEKKWKEEQEQKRKNKERLNRAGERIGDLFEAGMPLGNYMFDYITGEDMEDRSFVGAFGKQLISPVLIIDELSGNKLSSLF